MLKVPPLLKRTLVDLFDDVDKIKMITEDVDKRITLSVNFGQAALLVWHEVIKESVLLKKIYELLEETKGYYPDSRGLIEAENEIRGESPEIIKALDKIGLVAYKMGMLDLVNCARSKESNDFWKPHALKDLPDTFLTGLVIAPSAQSPLSLAERLVYEFIDVIGELGKPVYFARDPSTFRLRPLTIASKTLQSFEREIDRYLEGLGGEDQSVEYGACAHVLEIDVTAAENILGSLVETARKKFESYDRSKEGVNLLLFVFSYANDDQAQKLKALLKKPSIAADVKNYENLNVIIHQELVQWFNDNSRDPLDADINHYLEEFMRVEMNQKVDGGVNQEFKLPMNTVLRMQQQVFDHMVKESKSPSSSEDA